MLVRMQSTKIFLWIYHDSRKICAAIHNSESIIAWNDAFSKTLSNKLFTRSPNVRSWWVLHVYIHNHVMYYPIQVMWNGWAYMVRNSIFCQIFGFPAVILSRVSFHTSWNCGRCAGWIERFRGQVHDSHVKSKPYYWVYQYLILFILRSYSICLHNESLFEKLIPLWSYRSKSWS